MMLNLEVSIQLCHHLIVQISCIVGDEFAWYGIAKINSLLMNFTITFRVMLAYEAASTHLVK